MSQHKIYTFLLTADLGAAERERLRGVGIVLSEDIRVIIQRWHRCVTPTVI